MNVCGEYVCCVGMYGYPTQVKSWGFYLGDWRGGGNPNRNKKGRDWLVGKVRPLLGPKYCACYCGDLFWQSKIGVWWPMLVALYI